MKAIEDVALTASSEHASFAVRDAMKAGFRLPIEGVVLEKVYRFPVLAHWSFTCDGAGSFESLMRGIDVGLLGTLPGPGVKKARPPCAPAPLEVRPTRPRRGPIRKSRRRDMSASPTRRARATTCAPGIADLSCPRRRCARRPPRRSRCSRMRATSSAPSCRTAARTCRSPSPSRSGGCWRCRVRPSSMR